jgi:hypothetical protein
MVREVSAIGNDVQVRATGVLTLPAYPLVGIALFCTTVLRQAFK